jgi:DUF1365 family protein
VSLVSGIYAGRVGHTRFKPRRHVLAYRVFMLLLDLDELPALAGRLRLFSVGRLNLAGFDPRRHGDGSARPLKAQVEARLAEAGLPHGGPVRMLVMPQILGRGFNPLTVYYCHAPDGALSAVLYEVNNTFGERHGYLIPAAPEDGVVRQACGKAFYVSPFMDMDLAYAFRLRLPGETVLTEVQVRDPAGERVLSASFHGRRAELSDAALLGAWLRHPWMTVGVLVAIHWEALRIWLKGERVRPRVPAAGQGLTVVTPRARFAA